MAGDQNQQGDARALELLEDELRNLPMLEVPAGLEARLLAAIPPVPTKAAKWHRTRWRRWATGVGSTAAAAALIAAAIMLPLHPLDDNFSESVDASTATSPRHVLGDQATPREETRSCDILSPLPDGYSRPSALL
jgi:hypothetical protein